MSMLGIVAGETVYLNRTVEQACIGKAIIIVTTS